MTSQLILFYQDEFCRVEYDPEHNLIISTRIGYPNEDRLKKSLNKSLECIQQYKCPNIISDTSKVKGTWTGSNEWIAKEWFPKAIAAGLKNIAFIYPPDIFGQFALNDLIKKTPHYTTQVFKDMGHAKEWIYSLK